MSSGHPLPASFEGNRPTQRGYRMHEEGQTGQTQKPFISHIQTPEGCVYLVERGPSRGHAVYFMDIDEVDTLD